MKLPQRQSKLGSYLTVALGAGAAATSAEAGIVVTRYTGVGADKAPASTYGSMFNAGSKGMWWKGNSGALQTARWRDADNNLFWQGGEIAGDFSLVAPDTENISSGWSVPYFFSGTGSYGAQSGDDNYVWFGRNGSTGEDAVAQFYFDGSGGGYIKAIATDAAGLSMPDGYAAIQAVAATPEPAGFLLGGVPALIGAGALLRRRVRPGQAPSGLGLLALGAEGLRARRQQAAA